MFYSSTGACLLDYLRVVGPHKVGHVLERLERED
jgi:hypothetical protein